MPPDPAALWRFLPWGYLLTVALELPVLLVGLSPRHSQRDRLVAGFARAVALGPAALAAAVMERSG